MSYLVSDSATCSAYDAIASKALGLPRRGRHVGGGRHVDLDGPERHGWTLRWAAPRKHPTKALYAVPVLPAAAPKPGASTADLSQLATVAAAAVELDATWTPKPPAVEPVDVGEVKP